MNKIVSKSKPSTCKVITIIVISMLIQLPLSVLAQVGGSHKHTDSNLVWYTDSLKNEPYVYALPFLGAKVQKLGFDIPLPLGIMVATTVTQQSITINDLAISKGLDSTYYYVSNVAKFGGVTPLVYEVAIRPDIWVFPFLNVSGLFGSFSSSTEVQLIEPWDQTFTSTNSGNLVGYGVILAGGAGPLFGTLGFNQVWSFTPTLAEPGISYEAAIRIGHNHKNRKSPWKGWSVWVGAEWLQLNKETIGAVDLNTLTGISQDDKQQAADELDEWFNDLPPLEQKAAEPIVEHIDGWLRNDEDSYLYYDFVKEMVNPFSFVVGGQYQFSKHWQMQVEGTFTPERWRGTFGFNYRFGFRIEEHKK